MEWTGYKVHLTETCDEELPHLITDVHTTVPDVSDAALTEPIQRKLAEKGLLPHEHLVDAGYVDADLVVRSQLERDVVVVGPVRPNSSWQAKAAAGYDQSQFRIDWQKQQATCPQGKVSRWWTPYVASWGNQVISVRFDRAECRTCPVRSCCTHAKAEPRHLCLRLQPHYEALERIGQEQRTREWQLRYHQRAGIEGTHSQGIRVCNLRQARYHGLAKTHLQHEFTAVALNCIRLVAWRNGKECAKTRSSKFARLALAG